MVPTVLANRKNESGLILGACYSQDGSAVYTGMNRFIYFIINY